MLLLWMPLDVYCYYPGDVHNCRVKHQARLLARTDPF